MSEKLRESLSAAVDSEADEFELRRVLDEVGKSPELAAVWRRFHAIGAYIRGEAVVDTQRDGQVASDQQATKMADTIWAAVTDAEGVVSGVESGVTQIPETPDSSAGGRRWLGPMTGMAVAATVALGVVFGLSTSDTTTVDEPVTLVDTRPEIPAAEDASLADIERSNAYMMRHVQHTAMNRGVVSFVKVATYQPQ